jgi:oxygen-independent coproporphyrinogen-3 oxidase
LIAGLPHQTRESWNQSLDDLIGTGAPHASVYMLEVDEDSRLGRELIAGGQKYHAHFVPDDDLTAEFYEVACERLNAAGIEQYEISNFARRGHESRHNLKYWTRQPYLGFGVDAHSMLHSGKGAIRFWIAVSSEAALQEAFFLGLRLNRGVDLAEVAREFGDEAVGGFSEALAELVEVGLVERDVTVVRLSGRGRMISNEVFERFIAAPSQV